MKMKFKLSVMVIVIMIVLVAGLAVLMLNSASESQIRLAKQGLDNFTSARMEYWKGRMDSHMRMLHTLSNIMSDYKDVPEEERRSRYDDMLLSVKNRENLVISIYTVWKPNTIDSLDSRFAGTVGATDSGQYAMKYTEETGTLRKITVTPNEFADTMAYLNGPNSKLDRVEHPASWLVNGRNTYLVRMMAPIIDRQTNETIGGVGIMLSIDAVQPVVESVIRDNENIAFATIYSGNGFILGSYVPERVGRMLIDVDTQYGDDIQAVNRAVINGENFSLSSYSAVLDTNLEIDIIPFQIGNSNLHWSIALGSPESYILRDVRATTQFVVIIAIIAIILVAAIIYFTVNMMTKPLVTVAETLKDISEGEGDLTRTVENKTNDEIGDLAKYFNQTMDKIRKLIMIIKNQTVTLSDTGTELSSNMTQTAAAVNQITANIQSIKGRVINQSASVTQTNATMEQITVNIDKLNQIVEDQASSVAQSSSSIEEMLANIKSVTNTLIKNGENVKSLASASEIGRGGLQEVASDIQGIARESEGLLEINSVMENIASQTNLLSMNAAIEAAHAGEAGKGFAVVADEIRKLAESSGEQSKTIGVVLKKIKGSIDKISLSTDNVLNKFEAIDGNIKIVTEQEEVIRNAMEEQGEGSKQILEAVSQLNNLTQQVKGSSEEMLEGSKEVITESKNLERVTQEITGGMNEMASGAEQINIAVNRVDEISVKNRKDIDVLVDEIGKFKVE